MKKKRLTQRFPWLLPLRTRQRKFCFYAGMRLDGRRYAKTIEGRKLDYKVFEASSVLYNESTGFDMVYQENKVFNLKLAAKTLDGLLIRPGETFSFWQVVRHADKKIPYKDGLTVIDGALVTAQGGGLCQISSMLFWLFLHSPLVIVERHPHRVKRFPVPGEETGGVDATVSEGWCDLKMKNETDQVFQIGIDFDEQNIRGRLFSDRVLPVTYEIKGEDLAYVRKNGAVYERISLYRSEGAKEDEPKVVKTLLYENVCEIGYELPQDTVITE